MNHALALKLVQNTLDLAQKKELAIAVAVVDEHGELAAFVRMDECPFHAGVLAQNKAYTSARDRQPTRSLAAWAKETGKDMGYWSDPKFTGICGGLPITQDGKVIGGIGISGLSEDEDEALALEALAR